MGNNRDAQRVKEICEEATKRGLQIRLIPPQSSEQLAIMELVRPNKSETSFRQIEKVAGRKTEKNPGADEPGDMPKRERWQSRDERRFRVAQAIRRYCVERGLRSWDEEENCWSYAIFTAMSKKRLEQRHERFLADTDTEYPNSSLRHYRPTPSWDGSGDIVVIDTEFFGTDDRLYRAIEELFSMVDIEAAGLVPDAPWLDTAEAREIVKRIFQAAPLFSS